MLKRVKERKEYYIEFTDEECEKLNIKENQKFSVVEDGDGFLLKPYVSLEIDLSEFSRETLEFLISESVEKDKSVNEIIENVLKEAIEKYGN